MRGPAKGRGSPGRPFVGDPRVDSGGDLVPEGRRIPDCRQAREALVEDWDARTPPCSGIGRPLPQIPWKNVDAGLGGSSQRGKSTPEVSAASSRSWGWLEHDGHPGPPPSSPSQWGRWPGLPPSGCRGSGSQPTSSEPGGRCPLGISGPRLRRGRNGFDVSDQ